MNRKKLRHLAQEQDEDLRAAFITHMAQYKPHQLGFIDETSKDERTVGRRYGRSHKGHRAQKKQVFVRGRRLTLEAFLTLDGIVSATVVEGSMTKATFLDWLEHNVVFLFLLFIRLTIWHFLTAACSSQNVRLTLLRVLVSL